MTMDNGDFTKTLPTWRVLETKCQMQAIVEAQVQHLEFLVLREINPVDYVQSYLISSDRTLLLSENDAIKLELRNAKSRHETVIKSLHLSLHSAEQENKSSKLTFQQNLCLRTRYTPWSRNSRSLRDRSCLCSTISWAPMRELSVQKILWVSDKRLQSLQQDLEESEKRGQSLQKILGDSQERTQSLQQNLASFEKNIQTLS
ncbi:uncharacterized protein LOC121577302 [Coregonus clupeaformis]|uniref:uncharacterized protein LOC121577302 n=1 Tax=Coregonus clupeaformis TaxID=59861 RepID=UPI001BE04E6A|nr:uncharacterized protein LOC121577302 [Coregonus clupeaformis]XP_041747001.1 uncharacterized protein LOC121577302 [Coregonus clupeaformis]